MRRQISSGISVLALSALSLFVSAADLIAQSASGSLGNFEGQSDVGSVAPPGTLAYDTTSRVYTITAAGAKSLVHDRRFPFWSGKKSQAMSPSPPR